MKHPIIKFAAAIHPPIEHQRPRSPGPRSGQSADTSPPGLDSRGGLLDSRRPGLRAGGGLVMAGVFCSRRLVPRASTARASCAASWLRRDGGLSMPGTSSSLLLAASTSCWLFPGDAPAMATLSRPPLSCALCSAMTRLRASVSLLWICRCCSCGGEPAGDVTLGKRRKVACFGLRGVVADGPDICAEALAVSMGRRATGAEADRRCVGVVRMGIIGGSGSGRGGRGGDNCAE